MRPFAIAFMAWALLSIVSGESAVPHSARVQVVMLGTGTPLPDPERSGPSIAVVVDNHAYLFDAGTGAYKRAWTANGDAFKTISCVKIAKDGMVYVCDRQNDRIQVFQKDGKFVKEAYVSKETKGDGSVWDVAFSPDQKLLYVADGHDKKVWILDRASLNTIGSFGDGGRYPGHFYGVGSVAVDSKGNVYTGETYEGKRVQKFVKR